MIRLFLLKTENRTIKIFLGLLLLFEDNDQLGMKHLGVFLYFLSYYNLFLVLAFVQSSLCFIYIQKVPVTITLIRKRLLTLIFLQPEIMSAFWSKCESETAMVGYCCTGHSLSKSSRSLHCLKNCDSIS